MDGRRITEHPILGGMDQRRVVEITVDGKRIRAIEGEPVAAALMAAGIRTVRYTSKRGEGRGVFCAIGRCTDCAMTVNGMPNVRTCVTAVEPGMMVETQKGLGRWPGER